MKIAFFGSSLVSSYWNGAATYYRGILRALARNGHQIRFFEPDAFGRQEHRDIPDPDWAEVVIYKATDAGWRAALRQARDADLVVKASGVGVFDRELEAAVLAERRPGQMVLFWDVDAPATLDRIAQDPNDPMRFLIPGYDMILTYGGGPRVVAAYAALGARRCVPIYNAVDTHTHFPVAPDPRFAGDLGFLGNRLPDREARVMEFFVQPATLCPDRRFLLGGAGWEPQHLPANIATLGHVGTADHNAFNCSPLAVLNINRESMARYGFSPATRIFEAAGAGACIISDAWDGIDQFLEPGREILVARDGGEVAEILRGLTPERAREIGRAALARVRACHTYEQRAREVEAVLDEAHANIREAAQWA